MPRQRWPSDGRYLWQELASQFDGLSSQTPAEANRAWLLAGSDTGPLPLPPPGDKLLAVVHSQVPAPCLLTCVSAFRTQAQSSRHLGRQG